jgi:hypothetical protein
MRRPVAWTTALATAENNAYDRQLTERARDGIAAPGVGGDHRPAIALDQCLPHSRDGELRRCAGLARSSRESCIHVSFSSLI